MATIVAVGIGGAFGAIARYLISGWIYNRWDGIFPLGTYLVNVLGSFILGFLVVYFNEKVMISPAIKIMITVGILGSFTTFSTFSVETLKLIQLSMWKDAALNLILSIVSGLFFAWLGAFLAAKS